MNLNNGINFIYDSENDKCYFNNEVISIYADVTTRTIVNYWRDFRQFNNSDDHSVRIVLAGNRSPHLFKSIEFLRYVLKRVKNNNFNKIYNDVRSVVDKKLSVIEEDDNMKLVLKDDNGEFLVECLDGDVQFVHHNRTGKNYFSNKVIAKCTGLGERAVEKHWSNFKKLNTNRTHSSVRLKVFNIDKPVEFKSFNFLTYVAYRSNQPEAVIMRDYISDAIDEKFNRDIGIIKEKLQIDNHAQRLDRLNSEIDKKKKVIQALSEQESQLYDLDEEVGDKCHSRVRALEYEYQKLKETQDAIYHARDASVEAEK